MLYGDEKAREMGRSILPSKWRGAHNAQHQLSRRYRHAANQALREMEWSEDGWDDCEVELKSTRAYQSDLRYHVRDRRDADKVAPVMRWAEAIVADVPVEDRRDHVAKLLPQNLVGWHAMTHIEDLDAFRHPDEPIYSYPYRQSPVYRRRLVLIAKYTEKLVAVRNEGLLPVLDKVLCEEYSRVPSRSFRRTEYGNPRLMVGWRYSQLPSDAELKDSVKSLFREGRPEYRKVLRAWLRQNGF